LPVKLLSQALGSDHTRRKSATEAILSKESPYDLLEKVCDLKKYYEFYLPIDGTELAALNNAWKWAEITSILLKDAIGARLSVGNDGWIKRISKKLA